MTLPQAVYPTESIDSDLELLIYIGGIAVTAVVGALIWVVWDSVRNRKAKRMDYYQTTKVRRVDGSLWYWTCWYCQEESTRFLSREAAGQSARHHTDHVERQALSGDG
jgi:hypothetical protein